MDTSNITIVFEDIILKGITLDYAKDIFIEFSDEITVHMFPKPAERLSETIDFINDSVDENRKGNNFQTVILDKKNNEFLGCAALHNLNTKTPEFGVWIKKSVHGNGFGKKAIMALKKWADKNLNYDYLLYPVADKNFASRKIPEFLGGKIFREYDEINLKGNNIHILEYRIYHV